MDRLITNQAELRRVCLPCKSIKEGIEIGRRLISYLEWHNKTQRIKGVGLAAIQLGILKRVCLVNVIKPLILINPIILEQSPVEIVQVEGCLSLPGVQVETRRPLWIKVKTLNLPEQFFGIKDLTSGPRQNIIECVAACHELDHINSRLIVDFKSQ